MSEPVGEHYFLIRSEARRQALEFLSYLGSGDQREQASARVKRDLWDQNKALSEVIAALIAEKRQAASS